MNEILVIGSINTDLVLRTEHFPAPGETIQAGELSTYPGGKGANQAVAAARQGSRVGMIGRVGTDRQGDELIENLKENGVDVTLVKHDEAPTGTAIVVVDAQGQNSIVVSPGANAKVVPEDVEITALIDLEAVLFQLEIPLETVSRGCELARKHGAMVLLNPAPARPLPDEMMTNIDCLLPNETELSLLSGKAVEDVDSATEAAKLLLDKGLPAVVVTLGAKGSLVVTKEGAKHIPPFEVQVVDTTGAGDAFIGGFAAALVQGKTPEEAARYGNACGALATTRAGAQSSLPTREEVERLLAGR